VKCVAGSVERLSGLVEVQVVDEDDALLVHKWYVSQRKPDAAGKMQRQEVHSAYVWRRI
jgi:hypothetical protein